MQQNDTKPLKDDEEVTSLLSPGNSIVYFIDVPAKRYLSLSFYSLKSDGLLHVCVGGGYIPNLSSNDNEYLIYDQKTKRSVHKSTKSYNSNIRYYINVLNPKENTASDTFFLEAELEDEEPDNISSDNYTGIIVGVIIGVSAPVILIVAVLITICSVIRKRKLIEAEQQFEKLQRENKLRRNKVSESMESDNNNNNNLMDNGSNRMVMVDLSSLAHRVDEEEVMNHNNSSNNNNHHNPQSPTSTSSVVGRSPSDEKGELVFNEQMVSLKE
ncbi:hypothetical protein ABK040_014795 [Willaertia magna]